LIWSVTFPAFYGPDEKYHFSYTEYLTTQHALIGPHTALYAPEIAAAVQAVRYNDYAVHPRATFSGDPHASVRAVGRLAHGSRTPDQAVRGLAIVHPPLYHVGAALVNAALGDAPVLTRYAAVRWYTAFWGVATVFFAWLLAAQVFRREQLRLLVAFLVAVQPMVALLSGVANHDQALIATFTAALAMMAFILRSPPAVRQGAWLGGAMTPALLVKGSALVLIPLAGLTYAAQALVHRRGRRVVLRSAALALGIPLVLAGWWYIRSEILVGSLAGFTADPIGSAPGPAFTLGRALDVTELWITRTYRTYWWHHFWYGAPRERIDFYVPMAVGGLGIAGLVAFAASSWRRILAPDRPLVRQTILFVAAALAVWLPVMWTDVERSFHGRGFWVAGGRYLLPAFPAVAILLVVGLRRLVKPALQPVALSLLAVVAAVFCWRTWTLTYAYRYYGDRVPHRPLGLPVHGGWHELFRRMSFDRPEFVTPATIEIALLLAFLTLGASVAAVVAGSAGGWQGATRARVSRRFSRVSGP
jgi:hypothetical protein